MLVGQAMLTDEIIWARTRLGDVVPEAERQKLLRMPTSLLMKEAELVRQAVLVQVTRENADTMRRIIQSALDDNFDEEDDLND